jgi:hypothetical protein
VLENTFFSSPPIIISIIPFVNLYFIFLWTKDTKMKKSGKIAMYVLVTISVVAFMSTTSLSLNLGNSIGLLCLITLLVYVNVLPTKENQSKLGENYTKPEDPNHKDDPKDWLSSALILSSALGHALDENEGVVVEITGDMNASGKMDHKSVVVYSGSDGMVHIIPGEDYYKNGEYVEVQPEMLETHQENNRQKKIDEITKKWRDAGLLGDTPKVPNL